MYELDFKSCLEISWGKSDVLKNEKRLLAIKQLGDGFLLAYCARRERWKLGQRDRNGLDHEEPWRLLPTQTPGVKVLFVCVQQRTKSKYSVQVKLPRLIRVLQFSPGSDFQSPAL